jgi:high-affinity iron transporter
MRRSRIIRHWSGALLAAAALLLLARFLSSAGGSLAALGSSRAPAGIIDIGVLVFREGLECVLVLAAVTASMAGPQQAHRRPVLAGVVAGCTATLLTWRGATTLVDDLTVNVPALEVQAATGLLAIVVLLVVMNWFFHRVYWTGWITLHANRRRTLLSGDDAGRPSNTRVAWGLALLGFSSVYREGVEVVIFLQGYRLRLGGGTVGVGLALGLIGAGAVAILTFLVHRRLPYRRMLVLTGVLLGVVLLVMVGEQAQEMQLARWLPVTPVRWLDGRVPAWAGLWFSIFPTVETLAAQALAALLVLGSYVAARGSGARQEALPA